MVKVTIDSKNDIEDHYENNLHERMEFRGRIIKLIIFHTIPIIVYSYLIYKCWSLWIFENSKLGVWLLLS